MEAIHYCRISGTTEYRWGRSGNMVEGNKNISDILT